MAKAKDEQTRIKACINTLVCLQLYNSRSAFSHVRYFYQGAVTAVAGNIASMRQNQQRLKNDVQTTIVQPLLKVTWILGAFAKLCPSLLDGSQLMTVWPDGARCGGAAEC